MLAANVSAAVVMLGLLALLSLDSAPGKAAVLAIHQWRRRRLHGS
jgi:hypothetical protein